jgi:GNAT superfamily N-acetyltransferase
MPAEQEDEPELPGEPAGSWYTWWMGDALPALPALPGFTAEGTTDGKVAEQLAGGSEVEALGLLRSGHHAYLAYVDGTAVGYGWCATAEASIGELGLSFALRAGERYLWGFATEPAWRGHGIYPRLLQAILRAETAEAGRFWIGHEPGNAPSARGILKAGFRRVGELFWLPEGGFGLLADGLPERGEPGASVLGARLLS